MRELHEITVLDVTAREGTVEHRHQVEDGKVAGRPEEHFTWVVDRMAMSLKPCRHLLKSRAHQARPSRSRRSRSRSERRNVLRKLR